MLSPPSLASCGPTECSAYVVVLVEPVDHDLPVDRHLPGELLDEEHVLHPIGAEAADARRRPRHSPDPASPLVALDRRRAQPVELLGREVLFVGYADDVSLEVVGAAVPAAVEGPGRFPESFTIRAPQCWQTLWKPATPPSQRRLTTIDSPCPSQTTWSPADSISEDRQMICQFGASTLRRSCS